MVEVNGENYQKQRAITDRIEVLLNQVRQDTAMHSSMRHTLKHPAYLELVGMGERIIPFLFHVATHHGADWTLLCLFAQLSGENPVPPEDAGKFYRIFMHWLKWYTENKKYQNVDVYYGLVG